MGAGWGEIVELRRSDCLSLCLTSRKFQRANYFSSHTRKLGGKLKMYPKIYSDIDLVLNIYCIYALAHVYTLRK